MKGAGHTEKHVEYQNPQARQVERPSAMPIRQRTSKVSQGLSHGIIKCNQSLPDVPERAGPALIITVGHRPFPSARGRSIFHFHGQNGHPKKREMPGSSTSASKRAKRQVSVATCEKWQREFNRDYQSLLWLRYDVDKADRSLVATLWCEVCRTYKEKIRFMRNFSGVWVSGSTNHKSSNIVDHGKSEQHTACMAGAHACRQR